MFSIINVYLDHLKFCVMCINGRRYICCSAYNAVCNEPTPALCNISVRTAVKLCTFDIFAFI